AIAPERVEDPAELVPARHDLGVEVRGGADLEHDAPLADRLHRSRIVGRLHAVTDPVRLEQLDDPGDLIDGPRFARVDGDAQPVLACPTKEAAVIGDTEGRRLRAGDIDADYASIP